MKNRELEERALADFAQVVGKTILVSRLYGWVGYDSVDLDFDPPILVKVIPTDEDNDICNWIDDWLDPRWDVEVLQTHPVIENLEKRYEDYPPDTRKFRSAYIFGHSYSLKGETHMEKFDFVKSPVKVVGYEVD